MVEEWMKLKEGVGGFYSRELKEISQVDELAAMNKRVEIWDQQSAISKWEKMTKELGMRQTYQYLNVGQHRNLTKSNLVR